MEMEFEGEEEVVEFPVSPSGQYLSSSVLSLTVFGVLEFQFPIHDLPVLSLINDLFLPINPRFSSVMVGEKNGVKKWKHVTVNLKDHVFVPKFPDGLSPEEYDECVNEYLSKIGMEQLPQSQPLWQIHKINYPTSNAAASLIFKLHHSLGDGYSLMGALLSCLQRVDNPSLPLTFPSRQSSNSNPNPNSLGKHDIKKYIFSLSRLSYTIMTSVLDFGRSLIRSSVVEDDLTPIRSACDGVEFRPMAITTMTFSLHHIKQIKDKLKVTVNDVMTGVILLGIRLYMKGESNNKSSNTNTTAMVLLNTRNIDGYKSVSEMVKPKAAMPWGNHFAFLHVPIPNLNTTNTTDCSSDPLDFVFKAHETIKRLRNNYAAVLTGQFLEICQKLKGPEATAKYIHNTLRNSSASMSNIIGPVEQMALANHPVKGLYFAVAGFPQSLIVTLISYVETLRATIAVEKGFIDPHKLKSCIQIAYDMIFQAAVPTV